MTNLSNLQSFTFPKTVQSTLTSLVQSRLVMD